MEVGAAVAAVAVAVEAEADDRADPTPTRYCGRSHRRQSDVTGGWDSVGWSRPVLGLQVHLPAWERYLRYTRLIRSMAAWAAW